MSNTLVSEAAKRKALTVDGELHAELSVAAAVLRKQIQDCTDEAVRDWIVKVSAKQPIKINGGDHGHKRNR
jgi:hypothetical protein